MEKENLTHFENCRPTEIDEDPQKEASRYGTLEEAAPRETSRQPLQNNQVILPEKKRTISVKSEDAVIGVGVIEINEYPRKESSYYGTPKDGKTIINSPVKFQSSQVTHFDWRTNPESGHEGYIPRNRNALTNDTIYIHRPGRAEDLPADDFSGPIVRDISAPESKSASNPPGSSRKKSGSQRDAAHTRRGKERDADFSDKAEQSAAPDSKGRYSRLKHDLKAAGGYAVYDAVLGDYDEIRTAVSYTRDSYWVGKQTFKGARRAAGWVYRAGKAAVFAVRHAASSIFHASGKLLMTKLVIPAISLLLSVVILATLVAAVVSFKGDSTSTSTAYEYITELDADTTAAIWAAGGKSTALYVNNYETTADAINIQTNIDYLLLFLSVHYGTVELGDQISGIFGGQTVKAEIKEMHDALYSWQRATFIKKDGAGHDTTVSGLSITMKGVAEYLSDHHAITADDLEQMQAISSVGIYSSLQALQAPFDGYFYIKDRWGWYVDSAGHRQHCRGVTIMPYETSGVLSCGSGTVSSVSGQSVTVDISDKDQIIYSHLTNVYVADGEIVYPGDSIGSVSFTDGLELEYLSSGKPINPALILPISTVFSGDGASIVYQPLHYAATSVRLMIAEQEFSAAGREIIDSGFKAIASPARVLLQLSTDEKPGDVPLPFLSGGQELPVLSIDVQEKKTKPPALYTEDTLLAAMETAGKKIEDSELREAIKDSGLGTPATRAAIIENLVTIGYIVREKRNLVPTDLASTLIDLVADELKEPELTAQWETALVHIQRGEVSSAAFLSEIITFTRQIVDAGRASYSSAAAGHFKSERPSIGVCPRCGKNVVEYPRSYSCESGKDGCGFAIWKSISGKTISQKQAECLLLKKKTDLIKGFISKTGKKYNAYLSFREDYSIAFEFPSKK